jgi:hypothetical protein
MYEKNPIMAPFLVIFFSFKGFFLILTLVIAIVERAYDKAGDKYDKEKNQPTNLQSYFLAVRLWMSGANLPRNHYVHAPAEEEENGTNDIAKHLTSKQQQNDGQMAGQQQEQIVQLLQQRLVNQQQEMEQRMLEQQQQMGRELSEQQQKMEQRMLEQQRQMESRMTDALKAQLSALLEPKHIVA